LNPKRVSEFKAEGSPCACTKEQLVALKGEYCIHGYAWGVGVLQKLMAGGEQKKVSHPVDSEKRRRELKEQARRKA
jgi:hypothetical protein